MYGFNSPEERISLWEALITISKYSKGALLVYGDFNNVLNMNDRIGSSITLEEVRKFRQ